MSLAAIEVILLITAVVNSILTVLVFTARRKRMVHFWFALLTGATATWTFAIYGFLSSGTDISTAETWARIYYVAAAIIIYALLEFSLSFPRRIPIHASLHAMLAFLLLSVIGLVVWDHGFISQVVVTADEHKIVHLYQPFYMLYVLYYVVMIIASTACFWYGLREVSRRDKKRFSRWVKLLGVSIAVSLAFGVWFNLFLPLFGNYEYIWAGPPFTLVFGLTMFLAIVNQRILDIRQAVARTVMYGFLLVSLVGVYSAIAFAISTFFASVNSGAFQTVIQIVIAIFLAFTIRPLKSFFDRITNELFYRDEYSTGAVLNELREVTTEQVRTGPLTSSALEIINRALHPQFASLYVQQKNGLHHYSHRALEPSASRRLSHKELIERLPAQYVDVIDRTIIEALDDNETTHAFNGGDVAIAIQLYAGKQRVAVMIVGPKQSGKKYDAKDQELLTIIADELSLAIQNSLRFHEIEQLNATLQERIDEATKELRASNAELQRLDEAKDEFISMASHQLRTPLTSVKGYISMVIEGDVGKISPNQKQLLSEAFTSSERMVHLINDFLNVSRLQTGKFMLDRRQIDLAKVVEQELDSLKTTAQSHGMKLRYKKPSHFPVLYIDEGKIRQVIMNFVDNAVYYSREDSTIHVGLAVEAGDVVFTVKDTGIGVPVAEQKHLFGKFFRATNARTQRPDGTGVGLFLAKKVVVAHGGSMVFHSTEGEGSTFGFRLPVRKMSQPPKLENTD